MLRDKMQRQRFEFKYLLDEEKALDVRAYVAHRLELDESGVGKPNYSYAVNSLYLDSPALMTFWDWVNSNRNRFKLRMRYYDEKPTTPLFLEIKRRVSGCILKQRCAIKKSAIQMVLDGQIPPPELMVSREAKQRDALENFVAMVTRMDARPMALVTYLREAYIDPENEGVRVTLDRQVRIGPRETADLTVEMEKYVQPFGHNVILELKFTNRFPDWFGDMVRALCLSRSAAAKYCEGMANMNTPQLGNWVAKGRHRRGNQFF